MSDSLLGTWSSQVGNTKNVKKAHLGIVTAEEQAERGDVLQTANVGCGVTLQQSQNGSLLQPAATF